jgi:hypothetical protein
VGPLLQAGIEIIPLEPDQCSDLRREAPSVTLTFPPFPLLLGVGADSGITDVLFFTLATTWLQAGTQSSFSVTNPS